MSDNSFLDAVEIVAHRGAGKDFARPLPGLASRPAAPPENTLPALEWGWRAGGSCEIDVRLTRDRRAVVLHDATTGRTCDRDLVVAEEDLATLRRLDAGARKPGPWRGLRLPTLAEALAAMPPAGRLWVELKDGPALVEPVAADVEAAGVGVERVVFISFNVESLAELKRRLPGFGCFWTLKFRRPLPGSWWLRYGRTRGGGVTSRDVWRPANLSWVERTLSAHRLDGLDVSCRRPPGLTAALRERGIVWGAWNVDAADAAVELARSGAIQLTTNAPGDLRAALAYAGIPCV